MDTTDLEARLRDWRVGGAYLHRTAADALAQQRAEIARLREALVTAAIPLEAMRLSGADKMHGPKLEAGISEGITAARQALEPRHD